MALLTVDDLKTYFETDRGIVKAVDGVSFEIRENEVFCIVGETGCGKSVTALSILRLIAYPGKVVDGSIVFKGNNLLELPESEMRKIRGKDIAMVFQNPMNSLNPVYMIGTQISEAPITHFNISSKEGWKRAVDLIDRVKMPDPEIRSRDYPHIMSGGMRQRSMIAMMISCEPSLLIADEPTTAVDVTIQAQLLDLLKEIKEEQGMSIMLITHNFGLVAEIGDRVAVMYSGKIVEIGSVGEIFNDPAHPYTQGLMSCLPIGFERKKELRTIPGTLPDPTEPHIGCRFHPRCGSAQTICMEKDPALREIEEGHQVACHFQESP